ncbi:MAG: TatD family hydrolase [Gemmataceae bacterium]
MATLIDTHAHLDDGRYSDDRDEVLARAARAGVGQVIAIGITIESSRASLRLAQNYPSVFAAVGLHPNEVGAVAAGDWDEVVKLAAEPGVVGIGETGLDRYRDRSPFATQEDYFARHLELGRRLDRAVVIHAREADDDVLRLLRARYDRHGPIRAVLHSFTGSPAAAAAAVAMGLHVSIAGMVTYPKAQDVRDMAATVPLDRLLVETDSPYLSPQPVRGKRNEPAFVTHTAAALAGVFGVSVEVIAEHTTRNARALFGLPAG